MRWRIALLLLVGQLVVVAAQPPPQPPPKPAPKGPDDESYLRPSEPLPPLKLDYFVGKWTFEWEMPEDLFGAGGTVKGTEVYKPSADGKFIESDIEATGPGGGYTQHAVMAYNEAGRVLSRYEKDSRGFESFSIGRITTDQGFYLINFDGSAFTFKGKTFRFRTVESLMGPGSYRLRVQVSTGGGPYQSLGNPWWRKELSPPPKG